jgi:hypothetical protein
MASSNLPGSLLIRAAMSATLAANILSRHGLFWTNVLVVYRFIAGVFTEENLLRFPGVGSIWSLKRWPQESRQTDRMRKHHDTAS